LKTIRETKVGKSTLRLVKSKTGYSGIAVLDGAITAEVDGENEDEVWMALHDQAAKSSPSYFGFDGAKARFLRIFPGGLSDKTYLDSERAYKLQAKEKLDQILPLENALTSSGLGEEALSVFRATNLLSPFEKTRLQAALRGPNADQFIRGAAKFTLGDTKTGISEMSQALKPDDVAKWTVITYLPFLWQPTSHMFLKPEVTKNFAERVGHNLINDYSPELDPSVYSSLLSLTNDTGQQISSLEPRDNIDIQSFIYVVGEYDVETEDGSLSIG
jgi:hypothetical protein